MMVTIIIVLSILYLLAIMPEMHKRPNISDLQGWHYAHRGLYNNESDAPENSMTAFRKAIDAGFGIEMDVQLTKDRVPVVFHDEDLERACGKKGNVRDYTYRQLQEFPLFHTNETIPLFSEFLKLADGKVPLIIEIKAHENTSVVCSVVDEILKGYKGIYCVESFHPLAVRWYRKHRPEVIRGQLSSNLKKPGKKESIGEFFVHYLLTNFLCRPDFIAYDKQYKNNVSRLLTRKLYGVFSVAWTIKSKKELEENRKDFDVFIFEGFIPER